MAFTLVKYIEMKYRLQGDQQRNQQLIPDNRSVTEYGYTVDHAVAIQQPNIRQNNELSNVQSNELQPKNHIGPKRPKEESINFTVLMMVAILYVIPFSLIAYGVIHLNDCPAQNMIAVSFIINGCLLFLSRIFSSPEEIRSIYNKKNIAPTNLCLPCLNLMIQIIIIGFFFTISYWILSMKPETDPKKEGSSNYCEKELYKNTYYGCIVGLVFVVVGFFGACCFWMVSCIRK